MSGLARIALASILLGVSSVVIKLAYHEGANVPAVLTVRALAVLPWLGLLALAHRRALAYAAWPTLTAMAVLAAINVVTFSVAVERMSPALVALLFYAYPVLVIAGAHFLGWTRFRLFTGLAAASTLLGVGLTIGLPEGEVDALAMALSLLNAAGYALYLLLGEFALRRVDAITSIAFVAGLSSTLLLAGTLAWGPDFPESGDGIIFLVALLFALLFPHVLILSGVRRLGGAWGSLVSCLEVVTTVVGTALVLGLPLGPGVVAGGLLVVLGGVLAPIVASHRGQMAVVPR